MSTIKIGDKVKFPYFDQPVEVLDVGACTPGGCLESSLSCRSPISGLIFWAHCADVELVPEPATITPADLRLLVAVGTAHRRNRIQATSGTESSSSAEPAPQYKTIREVAVTSSTDGPLSLAELEHLCALARENGYPDDAAAHLGDPNGIDVDSWSISTLRVRTT